MKLLFSALAGAVLLAGPAFAGHSTPREREATRQLNLEATAQAKSTNQQIAANAGATAQAQVQTAPDAAPTTPVESAPAGQNANPANGGDAKAGGQQ